MERTMKKLGALLLSGLLAACSSSGPPMAVVAAAAVVIAAAPAPAEAAQIETWVNAKQFGMVSGGTTANGAANLTALTNAIASLGVKGGTVEIPCGFYYVNAGLSITASQPNITVRGCADGWTYVPLNLIYSPTFNPSAYEGGTVIMFSSSAAVGISMLTPGPYSQRITLRDMLIAANSTQTVSACIKASGSVHLLNMSVMGCQDKGIWLYELINSTLLDRVGIGGNTGGTGIGLFVGTGGVTFNDNTIFKVTNSTIRQNTVGVRIEQANTYVMENTVIESNAAEGLILYKQATPAASIDDGSMVTKQHSQNSHGIFDQVWFENNGAGSTTINNVKIYSATAASFDPADVPNNIFFKNSRFTSYSNGGGGWKPNIEILNGSRIRFFDSIISTGDPYGDGLNKSPVSLGSYSQWVNFRNTLDTGTTGSNAIITNIGSENLVLDFQEYSNFVATLTGCTVSQTGIAYYWRNGRQVTIDWPSFACTTDGGTAHTITGMPPSLIAGNAKVFSAPITNAASSAFGRVGMSAGTLTLSIDAGGNVFTPGGAFAITNFSTTFTTN